MEEPFILSLGQLIPGLKQPGDFFLFMAVHDQPRRICSRREKSSMFCLEFV